MPVRVTELGRPTSNLIYLADAVMVKWYTPGVIVHRQYTTTTDVVGITQSGFSELQYRYILGVPGC